MSLSQSIVFGVLFPIMFCSLGTFFARKGYINLKTKKDKKSKCLSKTRGKIVSVCAM